MVRQLPRSQVQTWFALSCERITMAHRHQSEGATCWQSDTAVLLVRCPVSSSATIRAGTVEPLKRRMYFGQVPLPQYPELVSPPPKILNRFFLSATSAVYIFSAKINYYYLHLQLISIDLKSIEAIYIAYCL